MTIAVSASPEVEGVVRDGGEGLVVVVPVVSDVGRPRVCHTPQHQPTLEILVLKMKQLHWKIAECRGCVDSLNNLTVTIGLQGHFHFPQMINSISW